MEKLKVSAKNKSQESNRRQFLKMEILRRKNTITKIKDSVDGANNRMEGREEKNSKLEDRK